MTLAEAIGQVVRTHRERGGYTQKVLGHLTGMFRSNVARIEAGHFEPRIDTLCRLADAFGLSASALLYEAEILQRMSEVNVA